MISLFEKDKEEIDGKIDIIMRELESLNEKMDEILVMLNNSGYKTNVQIRFSRAYIQKIVKALKEIDIQFQTEGKIPKRLLKNALAKRNLISFKEPKRSMEFKALLSQLENDRFIEDQEDLVVLIPGEI